MADKVFVERRPQGDYAIRRPNSQRASGVEPTQAEAIAEARRLNPGGPVFVERVRTTNVGKPDKWRKAVGAHRMPLPLFQTYWPTPPRRFAVGPERPDLGSGGYLSLHLKERLQMGDLRHG